MQVDLGRTRRKGRAEVWEIRVEEYLSIRVSTFLIDPKTRRPAYGARSALVNQLLNEWATRQEAELAAKAKELTPA